MKKRKEGTTGPQKHVDGTSWQPLQAQTPRSGKRGTATLPALKQLRLRHATARSRRREAGIGTGLLLCCCSCCCYDCHCRWKCHGLQSRTRRIRVESESSQAKSNRVGPSQVQCPKSKSLGVGCFLQMHIQKCTRAYRDGLVKMNRTSL